MRCRNEINKVVKTNRYSVKYQVVARSVPASKCLRLQLGSRYMELGHHGYKPVFFEMILQVKYISYKYHEEL